MVVATDGTCLKSYLHALRLLQNPVHARGGFPAEEGNGAAPRQRLHIQHREPRLKFRVLKKTEAAQSRETQNIVALRTNPGNVVTFMRER